jgi:hypothetical protein
MTPTNRWMRAALAGSLLIAAAQCAPAFDRTMSTTLSRGPLRCALPAGGAPQPNTVVVGRAGGDVELTPYTRLEIPRGALAGDVTFTIEQMGGDTVGVRITPPTRFNPPAEIRLDVGSSRCQGVKVKRGHWSVWRRSETGSTWERLPTKRPLFRNQIVGELVENSFIMIAD